MSFESESEPLGGEDEELVVTTTSLDLSSPFDTPKQGPAGASVSDKYFSPDRGEAADRRSVELADRVIADLPQLLAGAKAHGSGEELTASPRLTVDMATVDVMTISADSGNSDSKHDLVVGTIWMAVSALVFSAMSACIKVATNAHNGFNVGTVVCIRGVLQLVGFASYVLYVGHSSGGGQLMPLSFYARLENSERIGVGKTKKRKGHIALNTEDSDTKELSGDGDDELSDEDAAENASIDSGDEDSQRTALTLAELRLTLAIRGTLALFSICGFALAIERIPLGDAVSLFSVYPLLTALNASFFLRERLTKTHALALLICFVGTVLISRPEFAFGNGDDDSVASDRQQAARERTRKWLGICGALGAAFFGSFVYIIVRKIKKVPFLFHVLAVSIAQVIGGFIWLSIACIAKWNKGAKHDDASDALLITAALIGVGVFGFVGQCAFNFSAQLLPAGLSSLIRASDVIYAFIFELMFWKASFKMTSAIGAVNVLLGIVIVSWQKLKHARPQSVAATRQVLDASAQTHVIVSTNDESPKDSSSSTQVVDESDDAKDAESQRPLKEKSEEKTAADVFTLGNYLDELEADSSNDAPSFSDSLADEFSD